MGEKESKTAIEQVVRKNAAALAQSVAKYTVFDKKRMLRYEAVTRS